MILEAFTGAAGDLTANPADLLQYAYTQIPNISGTAGISRDGSGHAYYTGSTGGDGGLYYQQWIPASADYVSLVKIRLASAISQAIGVFHRMTSNASDLSHQQFYFWQFYQAAGLFYIYKYVGSSLGGSGYSLLGSSVSGSISDGDLFEFEVSGSSTVTLVLRQNGTVLLTETDSSSPITAAGSCGLRLYSDVAGSPSTGYQFELFEASLLYPEFAQAGVLSTGGCEVSWDRVLDASLYTVYRAAMSGGSYSSIGTTTNLYYDDAGYSASNVYRVAATLNGTIGPQTAEIDPVPYANVGVVYQPPRHDVLVDASRTYNQLAIVNNLQYNLKTTQTLPAGPTSQAVLFDDTFQAGSPLSTLVAGTVSSCGGGSCVLAAGAVAAAVLCYEVSQPPAPNFATVVTVSATTGNIKVGYGSDDTHGVFARYNSSTNHIDIYGVNGGGETSILGAVSVTLTAPYQLALEVGNLVFQAWYKSSGGSWASAGVGYVNHGTTYDLRIPATLAAWFPEVSVGDVAGSSSTTLTEMKCIGFSGTGMQREIAPITDLSGRPVKRSNGRYLVCADRCGQVPSGMGNATSNVCYSIHEYDPTVPGIVGGPICSVSMAVSSLVVSAQDAKIIYDSAAGGFRVWANDWSTGNESAFPSSTHMYYQLITGTPDTLPAFLHMNSPTQLTLPGGVTNYFYGCDVFYANSTWYLVCTNSDISTFTHTFVLSGSSPSSFSTTVASDTSNNAEGTSWFFLGDRIYALAGLWSTGSPVQGPIRVWDFSPLNSLTYIGLLTYPNPDSSMNQLSQQPSVLWYVNGSGYGVPQLLGFKNTLYASDIYDEGPLVIYEPTLLLLSGSEFPAAIGGLLLSRRRKLVA